jgi:hypothetical protein
MPECIKKFRKIKCNIELDISNGGIRCFSIDIAADGNPKLGRQVDLLSRTGGSHGVTPSDVFLDKLEDKMEGALRSLASEFKPRIMIKATHYDQ